MVGRGVLEGQVFGEVAGGTGCWGRGVRRTGSWEGARGSKGG